MVRPRAGKAGATTTRDGDSSRSIAESSAATLPRSVESSFLYIHARSSQCRANQRATAPARSAAVPASTSRLAVSKASTAASGGAASAASRHGTTSVAQAGGGEPDRRVRRPGEIVGLDHPLDRHRGYPDSSPSTAAAAYSTVKVTTKTITRARIRCAITGPRAGR